MLFPVQSVLNRSESVVDVFNGYDHNLRISEDRFFDTKNLTSEAYPLMTARSPRRPYATLTGLQGILAKDALAWIKDNTLYYNGYSMQEHMTGISITSGQKTMISMGAYICIFPDGIYFNTENYSDNGYMARSNSVNTATYNLEIDLCTEDGTEITYTKSAAAPTSPQNGDYWLDTSQSPHTLKQWAATTSQWISVPTVYVRLSANGIGQGFSKYDGIRLSGLTGDGESLNGSHILYDVSASAIVIIGIVDETITQTSGTVKAERKLPDMDFITESGNRLWGCKYGVSDGKTVNEIYCCKLGDFRNWESYMGISTDSWRASVGTDGAWTGAATIADSPVFFKEDCMHRVYPSSSGAHRIVDQKCEGVQRGSGKSTVVIGGRLYYKSRLGVCMYDGSLPVNIGGVFGTELYHAAVAGTVRGRYYISMLDSGENPSLFVYDTKTGIWMREDGLAADDFATIDDQLYCVSDGVLTEIFASQESGAIPFDWYAESGIIGLGITEQKYVSHINLRMQIPRGTKCDFYIQYDSDGVWRHSGHIDGTSLRSFTIPLRPARCDHFRFRIAGTGPFKLFSISKHVEAGSDVVG